MLKYKNSRASLFIAAFLFVTAAVVFPATKSLPVTNSGYNEADYKTYKKQNPLFLDAGKKYNLKPGDTFCIDLETNPTTGYDWHFSLLARDKLIVRPLENRVFQLQKKPATGAPSRCIWKFQVLLKGNNTIVYKYYRSWEGEKKAIQEKSFFIIVK